MNRVSFDGQAAAYEDRAGLPEAICGQVAAQLLEGLSPSAVVVDVGAGTGAIGRQLVGKVRYLGMDVSRPMLSQFEGFRVQADADQRWPIGDGAADVILFSRSAHLLKNEATLGEVLRIGRKGTRLFIGRVRRPRESAGEQVKRTMQHMLRDRGVPGRNGERAARDFLEALVAKHARPVPDWISAEWSEEEAVIDSLESWKSKDGLGGRVVDAAMKAEILDELSRWAEEQFGDLTKPRPVARYYRLEGVQLAG